MKSTQRGSILLATLLVCVGCSVLLLCLNALVAAGLRAALAERAGQAGQADAEKFLGEVRAAAWEHWEPGVVFRQDGASGSLAQPEGFEPGNPNTAPYLQATVHLPAAEYQGKEVESRQLSGLVERAWDGVELPPMAIVAGEVVPAVDRTTPGILPPLSAEPQVIPVATQFRPVEYLGDLLWTHLTGSWGLDEGTMNWLGRGQLGLAPGVAIEERPLGAVRGVDTSLGGDGPESPLLLITIGGGVIDARNLGEMWGVLVGAEDILLDGTILHGAAFCTGNVQLGHSGCVVYEESVRQWATDRSLYRVRLVPGTRMEEWWEEAP